MLVELLLLLLCGGVDIETTGLPVRSDERCCCCCCFGSSLIHHFDDQIWMKNDFSLILIPRQLLQDSHSDKFDLHCTEFVVAWCHHQCDECYCPDFHLQRLSSIKEKALILKNGRTEVATAQIWVNKCYRRPHRAHNWPSPSKASDIVQSGTKEHSLWLYVHFRKTGTKQLRNPLRAESEWRARVTVSKPRPHSLSLEIIAQFHFCIEREREREPVLVCSRAITKARFPLCFMCWPRTFWIWYCNGLRKSSGKRAKKGQRRSASFSCTWQAL